MKLVVEMMVRVTTKCLFRSFSLQKNRSRNLKVDVPTLEDAGVIIIFSDDLLDPLASLQLF